MHQMCNKNRNNNDEIDIWFDANSDTQKTPTSTKKYDNTISTIKTNTSFSKFNRYGGTNLVLFTCVFLMIFVHSWDGFTLRYKGKHISHANYAFRETIRETRRAKTLNTYARKRGPMIHSVTGGYDPLESEGVTHLEDAFGGLISGPSKLWKYGEIHVYDFKKKVLPPSITISQFQISPIHWNNGLSDPCFDRVVYIGGQKIPQIQNVEFITVAMGFLRINCSRNKMQVQEGYLTILNSATHGGNLVGRVYSIRALIKYPYINPGILSKPNDTVHETAVHWSGQYIFPNPSNKSVSLNLTEIGSLIEQRGNGDPNHYFILLCITIFPFFVWMCFWLRLAAVEVIINMEVNGNKCNKDYGYEHQSSNERKLPDNLRKKRELLKMREIQHTSFIDDGLIHAIWFSPIMHILYTLAIFACMVIKLDDENGVLNDFLPIFGIFKLNYFGMIMVISSQEIVWWCLSLFSCFTTSFHDRRILVYVYQYSPLLYLLNISNTVTSVSLVFGIFCDDQDFIKVLLFTCSVARIIIEVLMISYSHGLKHNPFISRKHACQIANISEGGYSLTLRGMSKYLATQAKTYSGKASLNAYSIPGLEFHGKVIDAILLGKPNLMLRGFINGKSVQIQIFESSTESLDFVKLKSVGIHEITLKRHWIYHGRVKCTIP